MAFLIVLGFAVAGERLGLTLAIGAFTMVVVSVTATWIPAWRATRVSPSTTLREDA